MPNSAADRIACIVPHCPRTARPDEHDCNGFVIVDTRVICAIHWRMIPQHYRRAYNRVTRQLRQADHVSDLGFIGRRRLRLWARLEHFVIERAAGL